MRTKLARLAGLGNYPSFIANKDNNNNNILIELRRNFYTLY